MTITRFAALIAGTAVVGAGVATAAPAAAVNNIKGFGVQETLKDFYTLGDYSSEIGYTVRTLRPSRDAVPYPVAGRLWESTVTADSLRGTVNPKSPNFIARSEGGDDYRALGVSNLSGAPLDPGGSTTGKLYFDVVGPVPNSVIFNDHFEDLLGWVNPPAVTDAETGPEGATGGGSTGSSSTGTGSSSSSSPDVSGSTGPMQATPPSISNGAQNGPYGPSGSTPPVGN